MQCLSCGTDIPEGATMCPVCEEPLTVSLSAEEKSKELRDRIKTVVICPVCGTSNPPGLFYCKDCGSSLGYTAEPTVAEESKYITEPITVKPKHVYLKVGSVLQGGRYIINDVLGHGGFSITYLAEDTILQGPVVVKEFFIADVCSREGTDVVGHISLSDFVKAKRKFLEDAHIWAGFNYSGLIRVYGTFEENNTAYMVMEYLKGKTLLQLLEEQPQLPESEAVSYIEKVGEALEYLHQQGWLHCDVKPGNIFVCEDGRVILMEAAPMVTPLDITHEVILTPGYAPLEQYASRSRLGTFTDVYALGATLYHLLTGHVPVSAPDRAQGEELPNVQQLNPEISERVVNAVMEALAITISDRPQTVKEFLAKLIGKEGRS